jgi:tetratricopeptide (TPR) repeat protein
MNKRRMWIAVSLAAMSGFTGCATGGGMWPSSWFASKDAAPASTAQYNARNTPPAEPSRQGANAQLGAPPAAAAAGPLAALAAPFKSWGSNPATPPSDPLSLDNKPKQLSAELYVQIARMHEEKGDFPSAITQYEQALKVAPNNTDILVSMARAQDRKGDVAKAVATYQQAIKIDARCALAYNDLGLCYARQRDLPRAQESLQQAVALVPTSKLYRNNLATVLADAKRYNEAYEQLATVHPPAVAQFNLGVLAGRAGDKNEAMARLQQSAAIDPNFAPARQMIDKLNGIAQQQANSGNPGNPAPPALAAQGQNAQAAMQDQAKQYQQQLRDTTRQLHNEVKSQAQAQMSQVKAQAGQARTQFADHVRTQAQGAETRVQNGVDQVSQAKENAIREAKAKLEAALPTPPPQPAAIAPASGDRWVPPASGDITPIEPPPGIDRQEVDRYWSESDENETPVLLPATN